VPFGANLDKYLKDLFVICQPFFIDKRTLSEAIVERVTFFQKFTNNRVRSQTEQKE